MARNEDKYFYLNLVGIEKDSWTLERFLQDAKEHCMVDLLPKFLIQRLTDYYQLMDRLAITPELPAGAAAATPWPQPEAASDAPAVDQSPLVGARRGKKKGGTSQNQISAASEASTVDDSADYWGTL